MTKRTRLIAPIFGAGSAAPFLAYAQREGWGKETWVASERALQPWIEELGLSFFATDVVEDMVVALRSEDFHRLDELFQTWNLWLCDVLKKDTFTHFLSDLASPLPLLTAQELGARATLLPTAPGVFSGFELYDVIRKLPFPPEATRDGGDPLLWCMEKIEVVLPWTSAITREISMLDAQRTRVRHLGFLSSPQRVNAKRDDAKWLGNGKPKVLAAHSTATLASHHAKHFFTAIDAAFPEDEYDLIATIPGIDARDARIVRFADHDALMKDADLVVCHGGWGTLSKAIAHNVRSLTLPIHREEEFNGALLAAIGVGERIRLDEMAWQNDALVRAVKARSESLLRSSISRSVWQELTRDHDG